MINFKNIITKTYLLLGLVAILVSCDLELQENIEFDPEVEFIDPFDNITAWEFIQGQTQLNEEGLIDGEKLNYMKAAIERAGMIEDFNNTSISDRTYLLLNNNAFTGGGDVIELVTGSDVVEEGETPEEVMARADADVLRLILQYHIVTSYVAQVPTLFEFDVNYAFQTLIPGDDGIIILRRDNRYRIDINRDPAPLPSSATSQWERVRLHNYVFNNGIGHVIADPVRNQPYPDPQ